MKKLYFQPLLGLSSKHLQMIISAYFPVGKAPPSTQWLVDIGDGDKLSCEVSIPHNWKNTDKTIILMHGLGGDHTSRYMVRMTRKIYQRGSKVVRINLRNCGSGQGLSKLPYGAGNSHDVLQVLQALKKEAPHSEIIVIGFSLGGNTALKLAGELGKDAEKLVKMFIAVCPPLDLEKAVLAIQQYCLYHRYYLKNILEQARCLVTQKYPSIYEFDDKITAPAWGFSGADEYYQKCSSKYFLNNIHVTTHLIFALDDRLKTPFVSIDVLKDVFLTEDVHVWTTELGSHLGFLGSTPQERGIRWLDNLLLNWIEKQKTSF